MPLLYGEGFKAFKRLQEEIIRQSDDETIFVHKHSSHLTPLAYSPADFAKSMWGLEIEKGTHDNFGPMDLGRASYTMTNKGVDMRAAFVSSSFFGFGERVIALNCHSAEGSCYPVLLPVQRKGLKPQDPGAGWPPVDERGTSELIPLLEETSGPHTYVVDLPKDESRSSRPIETAERFLDTWLATTRSYKDGDPFVYQTIYLAGGYVGRSRVGRTPWVK